MKVGDSVWLFDENRRVYPKNHTMSSAPIYSEHFYLDTIDGETSRSWLIGKYKYSKKNPIGIYTNEQKETKIWEHENKWKIVEMVKYCSIDKLKEIHSILTQNEN